MKIGDLSKLVKYMNGGTNEYSLEGITNTDDCPPGDFDCFDTKYKPDPSIARTNKLEYDKQMRRYNEKRDIFSKKPAPQPNQTPTATPELMIGPTTLNIGTQDQNWSVPMETTEQRGERLEKEAEQMDKAWSGEGEKKFNIDPGDPIVEQQERPYAEGIKELQKSKNSKYPKADTENNQEEEDKLIYNPYKGVDLEGAIMAAGMGFGTGNTDLAVAGTGLSLLKGARLGMSGYGVGKASKESYDYMQDQKLKGKHNSNIYGKKGGEIPGTIQGDEMMPYNSEVEAGEHIKDNQGNVEEVVGKKHTEGGEKMMLEPKEKIISDHLKVGKDNVNYFKENLGINIKAKDTFATVQDKINKKLKTKEIEEDKALLIEKMEQYEPTGHKATDMTNVSFFKGKLEDLEQELTQVNEEKQKAFDMIFEKQEASKPKKEIETKEENQESYFKLGGVKDDDIMNLASQYGLSKEEALEALKVGYYEEAGEVNPIDGVKTTKGDSPEQRKQKKQELKRLFGNVSDETIDSFIDNNAFWFNFEDFDPTKEVDVLQFQKEYNKRTEGRKLREDGKFGEETAGAYLDPVKEKSRVEQLDEVVITGKEKEQTTDNITQDLPLNSDEKKIKDSEYGFLNMGPDLILPPRALDAVLKQQARVNRYNAEDIATEPYIQSLRNQERVSQLNEDGLSPEVRAAVAANRLGTFADKEMQIRNQIDNQNRQNKQTVYNANVDAGNKEYALNNQYDLNYEQRQFGALEATRQDIDDYFNTAISNNQQKSQFIENMNILNQQNEDIYFDGKRFKRRKGSSDRDIMNNFLSRVNQEDIA